MKLLCWMTAVAGLCVTLPDRAPAAPPPRKPRIAVADFKVVGDVGIKDAGKAVAELLLTRFSTDKYQLVERSHLATLLQEQKLTMAEIVSKPALLKGGKLKGVSYLVVGSVVRLGNLAISARLVDVHTGDIAQTADSSAQDALGLQVSLSEVARVLQMTSDQKRQYVAARTSNQPTNAIARRRAAALSRVLAMAPPKTDLVLHLNVAAVGKSVLAALRDPKYGVSARLWKILSQVSARLVHIDYFGQGVEPLLVVFRGPITLEDMRAIHRASLDPGKTLGKLVPRGNGRYKIPDDEDPTILVVGKEADDVPDDVLIFAQEPLVAKGLLATLGKGDSEALRRRLVGVDTTGVFWAVISPGAMAPTGQPAKDDPTDMAFWVKSGKGREQACLRFTFGSNELAAAALKKTREDTSESERGLRAFFTIMSREGRFVTCLAERKECIVPEALSFLMTMMASGETKDTPAEVPDR